MHLQNIFATEVGKFISFEECCYFTGTSLWC
jgi:hypothetical protein